MYYFVTPKMGEFLKKTRIKLGILQEDLAGEVMSTGTVSNIENGNRRVGEEKLRYICEQLSIKFEDLLSLHEDEEQNTRDMDHLNLLFIESRLEINPEDAKRRMEVLGDNDMIPL